MTRTWRGCARRRVRAGARGRAPHGRRAHPRAAGDPSRRQGEQHRLAGLAPRPDAGRPHRRRGRHRAGLDRQGLVRALRAAVRRERDRLRDGRRAGLRVRSSSGDQLTGYYDAVHQQTLDYVRAAAATPSSTRIVDDAGTRRSSSAPGWSASSPTTCSTPVRPRSYAACSLLVRA